MKAFPSSNEVLSGDIGTKGHAGMDLRDYFAAKAMQGLLAEGNCSNETEVTKIAWSIADKMMEARKK